MAQLVWKTVDNKVHKYTVQDRETVIGRDPGCNIVLDDERVSRRHCSILKVEKSYILQDLGSRNGTFINHDVVSRGVLHDGVQITVGKTILDFQASEDSKDVSEALQSQWIFPDDWSSVEAVIESSIDPTDTSFIQDNEEIRDSRKLRRSHERLKMFYNVSAALGTIRYEKELVNKLLEELFNIFPAEQGFFLLLDKRMGAMKPVAARRMVSKPDKKSSSRKDQISKIVVSHTILEQLVNHKSAVLIRDATLDERFSTSGSLARVQLRSAMCVPLLHQDQVTGVIQLSAFSRSNVFTEDDLRLFTLIGNQTAVWLENIRLYEESIQKVKELSSLFDIGKAISANLTLDNVLDMIMKKSLELIHAQSGSIMLLDEENQRLKIVASVGLKKEIVESTARKIGEGISGWVAQHGQPLLLKDRITDSQFIGLKRNEKVKDALCVPLIVGNNEKARIIGVLSANNKLEDSTFDSSDLELLSRFATQAAIAIENARMYSMLRDGYLHTVKAFASAIEARDPYTSGHCERLTAYAMALGEDFGLNPIELEVLQGAALLHDIGKIGVKEEILQKPTHLTPEEYENIKLHPAIGMRILESIPAMRDLLPIIYHHQERYDGKGYPDGLSGESIPLAARIIAVVDAFDAMTSNRPYRKKMPLPNALDELTKHSGSQFDPLIVDKFIKLIHEQGWDETQDS